MYVLKHIFFLFYLGDLVIQTIRRAGDLVCIQEDSDMDYPEELA